MFKSGTKGSRAKVRHLLGLGRNRKKRRNNLRERKKKERGGGVRNQLAGENVAHGEHLQGGDLGIKKTPLRT